jgi:hypothetical protein
LSRDEHGQHLIDGSGCSGSTASPPDRGLHGTYLIPPHRRLSLHAPLQHCADVSSSPQNNASRQPPPEDDFVSWQPTFSLLRDIVHRASTIKAPTRSTIARHFDHDLHITVLTQCTARRQGKRPSSQSHGASAAWLCGCPHYGRLRYMQQNIRN